MQAATISKYQTKSIPFLKKKAQDTFNAFIRERDRLGDYFYCPTCNKTKLIIKSTQNYQACHVFPAGTVRSLRFNENNAFGGCKSCNYYGHGMNHVYNDWCRRKIGEEAYAELELIAAAEKRNGYKEDRFFLIQIIEEYSEKLKQLKNE